MATRPDLLDNLERTHADGLEFLAGDFPEDYPLSVATGYVNLGGLHHLALVVGEGRSARVLLGAMPDPGLGAELPVASFEHQMAILEGERNLSRFPPSRAAERLSAVGEWLGRPNVEVRRYVKRFLHGKAYLFGSQDNPRAALVSSANLTSAGLVGNLELGLADYNPGPSGAALRWFDGLWEAADEFKDELQDLLFPAAGLIAPEDVFRELFVLAGANERDPENLDPDVLFPIADAVSVRRDRLFIEEHYAGETFPDGTEVRFPAPKLSTRRYDLDASHPGLVAHIVAQIEGLEMARYMPSAWLVEPEDVSAETQLGGLLQSAVLKRFESCWSACLATVERMIAAHDAFLAAWEDGLVPSKAVLAGAAKEESDAGIASWVAERLEDDPGARPVGDFEPEYGDVVAADRERLVAIRDRLSGLSADDDPKLALLRELIETSPCDKIAVFASYGETVRYLDEHLPRPAGGRERVAVIGSETSPDERMGLLGRFCPRTVVGPDYVPPQDEVDLLLSTDVLSEGQNLQQAQGVISYDMPWNPQRVVQRNGRVIRLLSPHDEVFLTTMLPDEGELEELLRLESIVRAKIRAAGGVYGMESEVIEGIETELHHYAERLAAGELELTGEGESEESSGAFIGEELRARLMRAHEEGDLARIERLPWGVGAVVRRTDPWPGFQPGVFFAFRTRGMPSAERGHRYWRYVELDPPAGGGALLTSDLEMLRRIAPEGVEEAEPGAAELEDAWRRAADDVVEAHNPRADPRTAQEAIGPAQRFALELLRDPAVLVPEEADRAEEALSVERSTAVRRALNETRAELSEERINRNEAAERIVELVLRLGLQAVSLDDLPEPIDVDDLGVVCWMAVL